uniref:Uncharacterized protein n=1 Tax=viral metagenome TaxID=1070528 RepID=A0A6C0EDB8_9ZZZZ
MPARTPEQVRELHYKLQEKRELKMKLTQKVVCSQDEWLSDVLLPPACANDRGGNKRNRQVLNKNKESFGLA